MHLAIVGGGITGLSAAWELQKRGISYSVLEASNRWGGKVVSSIIKLDHGGQFLVEGGPDTLITRKPEAWQLAQELGLQDEVINPGSEASGTFVLDQGRIHPIPLSPGKFFSTTLISTPGKLRMLAEPFQKPKLDAGDESLADFVRRRLGHEALEKFIGPVLGGIYNTNPETQSILITSPVMREMEAQGGSLTAGAILRMMKGGRKKPASPRFISFKSGLQALVDELVRQLHGDLRLNSPVKMIVPNEEKYTIMLANDESMEVEGVILAAPANQTAGMISVISKAAEKELLQIRQQNIATVSMVYREENIPSAPYISGLMIPRREKRKVDAVTFPSRKTPERCSPGYAVVRVFLGGSAPELVDMAEEEMMHQVRLELADLLSIHAQPLAWRSFRWPNGFPQADVGHLQRIDELEALLPPEVVLAGSSYRGIAVPDCIRQGREAAAKLSDLFQGVL